MWKCKDFWIIQNGHLPLQNLNGLIDSYREKIGDSRSLYEEISFSMRVMDYFLMIDWAYSVRYESSLLYDIPSIRSS